MKRAAERLLLLAFGVGVALALGEAVARLAFPIGSSTCDEAVATPGAPVLHSLVDFARPNANGVMTCNVPYRTNRFGLRGPEIPLEKPPGVFRIAIGGDSVTMGSGVREEQTYAYRLQDLLNQRARPGVAYEVLNLGVAGFNLEAVVNRIEALGLRLDPDLIVYGWTINDIEGPDYRALATPEERAAGGQRAARFMHSGSRLLAIAWARFVALERLDVSYVAEVKSNYSENPRAWEAFTTGLDRLAEIQSRSGRCVVVFLHTHLDTLGPLHPFLGIYAQVEQAAQEHGLQAVGSFAQHRGRSGEALWIKPLDPHPNAEGHAILADALLDGLLGLPQRCWKGATPESGTRP